MARGKTNKPRMIELPKGFKDISGGRGSWDFENDTQLIGVVEKFGEVQSKYDKKKMQRFAVVGGKTVWESAALAPLFDVKKGTTVCLIFQGFRKIKGRAKPMKVFTVGTK